MAEEKALSSSSAEDAPTITVDELGKLSGLVAVPSTSTEALNELKLRGFTVEQEGEGVKLLAPPGGCVAGYSMTKHTLNATRPQPRGMYPTAAPADEYMQLPSVTATSDLIDEDHEPRHSQPEAVRAHVIIEPSIKKIHHGSQGRLRIRVQQFRFSSHRMVDTSDERGHFPHKATIRVTPKWSNPAFAQNFWPPTRPAEATVTTGKGKSATGTLGLSPTLGVGINKTVDKQVTASKWTLTSAVCDHPSQMLWKWQMKTWDDFQPFDPSQPRLFRVGGVPKLPYEVEGGIAGLTYTIDAEGRHMEAEWDVPKNLVTGNAGQLRVQIEIIMHMEIVQSKSFFARVGNKFVRVSHRPNPGFKDVIMEGDFAF